MIPESSLSYLALVAELAATFAGFTAIVTALQPYRKVPQQVHVLNRLRLQQMLEVSIFIIAACLLPFVAASMGIQGTAAIRASAGILTVTGLGLYSIHIRRIPKGDFSGTPLYAAWVIPLLTMLGGVTVVSFAFATFGLMPTGLYNLAVTSGFSVAAIQFLRAGVTVLYLSTAHNAEEHAGTRESRQAEIDQTAV